MWYKAIFNSKYSNNVETEYFEYDNRLDEYFIERDIKSWGQRHYSMFYTDVKISKVKFPSKEWVLDKMQLLKEKMKEDESLMAEYQKILDELK